MGAIQVTGLGKAYRQYASRWGRLAEWLLPFSRPRHQQKWVLHDISFAVAPGEAIGIIGINGAGKSTLLKLITGTSQPRAARSACKAGWRRCWSWAWAFTRISPAGKTPIWPAS